MKRRLVLVAFPLFMLGAGAARAGACQDAGSAFPDVPVQEIFCEEAHWAKNALITRGCGDGSMFCPLDPVLRSQMILFMRRLAAAVHPEVLFVEETPAPADLDTGTTLCATSQYSMVPDEGERLNSRFWHAHAIVSMQGGASDADVELVVNLRVEDAVTIPVPTVRPVVTVPAGQWKNATVSTGFAFLLAEGGTFRWRIAISRAEGSATTGELAAVRCQLKVVTSMAPFYSPPPGSDPR